MKNLFEKMKSVDKKVWIIGACVLAALTVVVVVICVVLGGKDEIRINGKTMEQIESMTEEEREEFIAQIESENDLLPSQAAPVIENVNEDAVKTKENISKKNVTDAFPLKTENGAFIIESLQKYSGFFIEDGSNIATENALAIVVENTSGKDIYFARIELDSDKTEENAVFEMSFIPAGAKVFVQERSNRKFVESEKFKLALCKLTEMDYEKFTKNFKDMIDTGYARRPESNCIILYNKTKNSLNGKVFYKQRKDGMFYGGKTYATSLPSPIQPDTSMYISVYHYNQDSVVVAATLNKVD